MYSQEVKNLLENIIISYNARLKLVKDIIANTYQTLEEFKSKREEISNRLRNALAKSENLRKKDFDRMMEEILTIQTMKEENVKKMLADFHQEEEGVVVKLKGLLEKGEQIKIKDFKKMLTKIKDSQQLREQNISKEVSSEIERMREEVNGMLAAFKKEREKIASVWPKMINKIA